VHGSHGLWHGGGDSVEMCASAWNCAPKLFLWKMLPGRHARKCHIQTKIEYISFASQPQKTCSLTIFSQEMVQPITEEKNAVETSFVRRSNCASIGNVHKRNS
jgi:hypothetical protein